MPLIHFTKWFAVSDAKISLVTADVSGSATTYGTSIDVPGVKGIELSGDMEVKELRGDNTLLDKDAVLKNLNIKVEHAKLSFDLLPMVGMTVADSGVTPNQKVTASLVAGARPKPFKFEAATPTGGVDILGGDGHLVLYKCIAGSFPDFGHAEEDYQTVSFEAESMPTLGTGLKWLDIVLNETASAIP